MGDEKHGRHAAHDEAPDPEDVTERAHLLPEERAAGVSADPQAQAEAILADSLDRTEHPDPDASTQSSRRRSHETS